MREFIMSQNQYNNILLSNHTLVFKSFTIIKVLVAFRAVWSAVLYLIKIKISNY